MLSNAKLSPKHEKREARTGKKTQEAAESETEKVQQDVVVTAEKVTVVTRHFLDCFSAARRLETLVAYLPGVRLKNDVDKYE